MNSDHLGGIHLRTAGTQGPLVICAHCSSSHSGQFKPYFEALQDRFRLIAPDMPGYGRSRAMPADGRPSFAHDADVIAALIAAEGDGQPVHLVGHSLGGATAFYAARDNAAQVASLTVIEPVLFCLLEEVGNPLVADAYTAAAHVAGYCRLGRMDQAAAWFVDFWSGPGSWQAMPEDTRAYVISTINRVPDDWAGMLAGLPGLARLSDCATLPMPVQTICGGATRASAAAVIALLRGALPDGVHHDLDGAGHMAAVTDPDRFVPLIAEFLAAQS